MSELSIDYRPSLSGGHLEHGVQVSKTVCVAGTLFWKVSKSDHVVSRVVLGKSFSQARPLARTTILETLVKARNDRVLDLTRALDQASEDLGLDHDLKTMKPDLSKLPDVISMLAPTVGGRQGMSMKVLPALPRQPLWLELSVDVVQYLHDVAVYQIEQEEHAPDVADCTEPDLPIGVTFCRLRDAYRVRRVQHQDLDEQPKKRCRYFPIAKYDSKDIAKHAAIEWHESGQPEQGLAMDDDVEEHPVAADADATT